MTADDFLYASAQIRLLPIPSEIKKPFYAGSLARYEALYLSSPRRHDCPFCRMLIRRHPGDWVQTKEHAERILDALGDTSEQITTKLKEIIHIGDHFANLEDIK